MKVQVLRNPAGTAKTCSGLRSKRGTNQPRTALVPCRTFIAALEREAVGMCHSRCLAESEQEGPNELEETSNPRSIDPDKPAIKRP